MLPKAVLLAAGKSTRTYPLTITTPNPLLKVANVTLLEHNLRQLVSVIDEVIIVVGYKKEHIINAFGSSYKSIKITYVDQKIQSGTGNALLCAEQFCDSDVLVMNGDDLYCQKDIKNLLKKKFGVLSKKVDNPAQFGVFALRNGKVQEVIEKPKNYIKPCQINCGMYYFSHDIFSILKRIKKNGEGLLHRARYR